MNDPVFMQADALTYNDLTEETPQDSSIMEPMTDALIIAELQTEMISLREDFNNLRRSATRLTEYSEFVSEIANMQQAQIAAIKSYCAELADQRTTRGSRARSRQLIALDVLNLLDITEAAYMDAEDKS